MMFIRVYVSLFYLYVLIDDVISYVHKKNCISFCVRNIKNFADKQSPLEVTEILVALSCCLKVRLNGTVSIQDVHVHMLFGQL